MTDNLTALFEGLEFDEKRHRYSLGDTTLPSVSSLIGKFHESFDFNGISKRYAEKRGFTVKQVRDAWKGKALISTTHGTKVHKFAEDYIAWRYMGAEKEPKVFCKQSLAVVEFFNNLPKEYEVVCTELRMYSKKYLYAGTTDLVIRKVGTDEYFILDFKTNEDIFSEYPQEPLYHIPLSLKLVGDSYGKYTLQLNLYQIMLEEMDIKVGGRCIIWLKEDKKKLYQTFWVKDVTTYLISFLQSNPLL